MNPQDSQKIFLSSASTVSLHDRFTDLLKVDQQVDLFDITGLVKLQTAASLKNQRLALEMASRPSVLAALRNTSNINDRLCKVSVKSRLGHPIGTGVVGGLHEQIRLSGREGGQVKGFSKTRGISRLQGSVTTTGVQRGWGQKQHGGCVNWAGPMKIRGGGGGGVISKTGNSGFTSVSGVRLGISQPRFNSQPVPSREQLDKQLDEYMSKSKRKLDAELDAYMAQVDLEDIM